MEERAATETLAYPVDELLDELLELDPEDVDEEPIFGQLCPPYEPKEPEVDVVVVVLDCANDANPITRAPIAIMAIIVTISRLLLLGRNSLFPVLCELIDKFCFTSVTKRKTLLMLISTFRDAS